MSQIYKRVWITFYFQDLFWISHPLNDIVLAISLKLLGKHHWQFPWPQLFRQNIFKASFWKCQSNPCTFSKSEAPSHGKNSMEFLVMNWLTYRNVWKPGQKNERNHRFVENNIFDVVDLLRKEFGQDLLVILILAENMSAKLPSI